MLTAIATGVIALIPYLALRQPNQLFSGEKDPRISVLESRSTGLTLAISTIVLILYAMVWGVWAGAAWVPLLGSLAY
jgi:hypothetical protein